MEVKMGMGRRGESGDCLASCMQMTWLCGESEEGLKALVGRWSPVPPSVFEGKKRRCKSARAT